jgi:hypothetical protein
MIAPLTGVYAEFAQVEVVGIVRMAAVPRNAIRAAST